MLHKVVVAPWYPLYVASVSVVYMMVGKVFGNLPDPCEVLENKNKLGFAFESPSKTVLNFTVFIQYDNAE